MRSGNAFVGRLCLAALLLGCLLRPGAIAKGPHGGEDEEDGGGGPPVRPAPHLEIGRAAAPPIIDGRLDEPAWATAGIIDELTQVEPEEDAPPSMPTEIRLLYDSNFLYIGIRAFDEPELIIANEMRHDTSFESDDHIAFIIDTFFDRRNAYRMRVNPLGARSDGLIEASRDIGDEWDGIWYAKTSIDDEGWVAEIAIPFKTVSFDRDGRSWGFNFERVIRRNNEVSRWTALRGGRGLRDVAQAGVLDGLTGLEQGFGLDAKPTPTIRYQRSEEEDTSETKFVPSFDAFYKITPSMTAAATFKTDFAEAEVDERELNLGRFDLFFPEKRDFFLQDAGIFEFGGLKRNGRPFFSRRIGLDARGEKEIPIFAGGKLTGRMGPLSIGLLDVETEETDDFERQNLAVGRATLDILEQSRVGAIATYGDPVSDRINAVFGTDVFLRSDNLFGENTVEATGWVLRSFGDPREEKKGGDDEEEEEEQGGKGDGKGGPMHEVDGREWAYGARLAFPNDPFEFSVGFSELQENFDPALGFVNRAGIRKYEAEAKYRIRIKDHYIRTIDIGGAVEVFTDDVDNNLETIDAAFDAVKLINRPGDSVKLTYRYGYEFLEEDEKIAGRIPIPAGTYETNRAVLTLDASPARLLSGGLEISYGGYFNGTLLKLRPAVDWRPTPHWLLGIEYEENFIRTPTADLNARLIGARLGYYFTPDFNISTLLQYDNLSREVGISARVRRTFQPGNEMFFIINRSYEQDEHEFDRFLPLDSEYAAKLGWTFRF